MRFVLSLVKFLFKLYFIILAIVHVAFYTIPLVLVQYLTFPNFINFPKGDLSNPGLFNLSNVYNFYINSEEDVTLGVWHFIPQNIGYSHETECTKSLKDHLSKYISSDNRAIVIYVHGNAHNRAFGKRRSLCKRLTTLGYHVFSIDYRGYGDSTGTPTEAGVVRDVLTLFNIIREYRNETKIFYWGHSLGSAIVAHAAKHLSTHNSAPGGIILESAFLNMSHAATEYLIAPFFYNNQWIRNIANQALEQQNIRFNTDKHIIEINSKILLLHAEDDWHIPHDRALDLLHIAKTQRSKAYPKVELMILEREHGLGHGDIFKHEDIYPIISKFIQ